MSPAKTAELIKMPFGFWAWVGSRNCVLDGVQMPPWERASLRVEGVTHYKV